MARGQKTSNETRAAFAEAYLRYGVASRAAREVGISASTGCDIAKALEKDETFRDARKQLIARAEPRVRHVLVGMVEAAADRFHEEVPDESARDKRPDYMSQVITVWRAIQTQARLDSEQRAREQLMSGQGPDIDAVTAVIDKLARLAPRRDSAEPATESDPDSSDS